MNEGKKVTGVKRVVKVLGNNILVKQLSVARNSPIFLPDSTIQKTFMGIIVDVGDKVKDQLTFQKDVVCLISSEARVKTPKNDEWIINPADIYLIKRFGGMYYPPGHRVLIKRFNKEEIVISKDTNIVIPAAFQSSDQTLFGTVFALGVNQGVFIEEVGFMVGDTIKIAQWDVRIREVEINDEYFLSVPLSLLEYTCGDSIFRENFIKE